MQTRTKMWIGAIVVLLYIGLAAGISYADVIPPPGFGVDPYSNVILKPKVDNTGNRCDMCHSEAEIALFDRHLVYDDWWPRFDWGANNGEPYWTREDQDPTGRWFRFNAGGGTIRALILMPRPYYAWPDPVPPRPYVIMETTDNGATWTTIETGEW